MNSDYGSNDTALPSIDPEKMIGIKFIGTYSGMEQQATVVDWTKEGQFIIKYLSGGEEMATYNDIINKFSQLQEESPELYVFKSILDHKKV